jgi:AcrR family transcriptional regulator
MLRQQTSGGGVVTTAGRQRVLDGALRLFSERGYADTSMRDIAQLLGLQNGSLYSHYRSKDELLEQALAPLLDGIDDLLRLDHPALKTRDWLAAYASHLAAHVPAVKLAGADLAVARHTTVGQRLADSNARTRRLLMRHDSIDEAEAAARLGRLWWPLICLPNALTEAELHALI